MVCRWRTTITMTWCPVIGITPGRLFAAFPQHQYPFWKRWCLERCLEYQIESHILDPSLDSYDWVTYYCIASSMAHSSGICYWLAHINASLQCIADDNFCANNKSDRYAPGSFFRSLILALLEWGAPPTLPSMLRVLFVSGWHSLPVTRSRSHWLPTASFVKHSLFIVDYSAWQDNCLCDQTTTWLISLILNQRL
jgi:hypothetical protein